MTRALVTLVALSGCIEPNADRPSPDHIADHDPTWWDASPPPPLTPTCAPGTAAELDASTFTTIQAALNAAGPYDTVVICPGTWTEYLVTRNAGPLQFVGATGDPADVVLDGLHGGRLFESDRSDLWLRIRGVTFRHGYSTDAGAGVYFNGFGDTRLQMQDVIIEDMQTNQSMLAAYARLLKLERVVVRGYRGPQSAVDIAFAFQDDIRGSINDCVFEDNEGGTGAAVHVHYAPGRFDFSPNAIARMEITNSVFRSNWSSYAGAGLHLSAARTYVDIRDSEFSNNYSLYYAPAMEFHLMEDRARVTLTNVDVFDNTAEDGPAVSFRGNDFIGALGDLLVNGGRFHRNFCGVAGSPGGIEVGRTWRGRFTGVDFGAGADSNVPVDFNNCNLDYGANTSGTAGSAVCLTP